MKVSFEDSLNLVYRLILHLENINEQVAIEIETEDGLELKLNQQNLKNGDVLVWEIDAVVLVL